MKLCCVILNEGIKKFCVSCHMSYNFCQSYIRKYSLI